MEITCKWTDVVSVLCMFIACNYKNTAYLCMGGPHTTSPERRIHFRTRVIVKHQWDKRQQNHWLAWTKLNRARRRNDFRQSWARGHKWWTPFISFLYHGPSREREAEKNKRKRIWTALGCSFMILLACVRVVMFTAQSLQEWLQWLHRWTSCICLIMGRMRAYGFSMSALLFDA